MTEYVENYYLDPEGHPYSDYLAGKAVRLSYKSGHVLEQHWLPGNKVLWKGISGPLAGHSQEENSYTFEIAENIFLITWMEAATRAATGEKMAHGPWLTDVVLDFKRMKATASWTGPTKDGQIEHVLDQADMEFVELEEA